MTPLEQELRHKMAGLKSSLTRTVNAKQYDMSGRSGKQCRDKADQLRREMRQLRKQIEKLAVAPIEPTSVKPGKYRHYKGKHYEVIGIARHSETLEELVVYRALYGERGLWVRPRKMFEESVVVDGRRVPRFEFVGREVMHGEERREGP